MSVPMEEGNIKAPLYYVMGRQAKLEDVQQLLTITPCFYGIAATPVERMLLEPLVHDVLIARDPEASVFAEHLARTHGRPVLIVGDGDQLKAVYSTGEEETLCLLKLT